MSRARSNEALIRIELFGGPVARIRDEEITFSPRQMALVALLFGHREGRISRAEVIWLIWEVDDGPVPRQKLRQLLRDVQERMRTRIVENNADPLQPDASRTSSDLDDFHQSLSDGRLLDAAKTLQLGFAARLTSTSAALADWLDARRLSLANGLRRAAASAWDEGLKIDDWESAHDAAEALYLLAPDDVPSLEKVIEARARVGRPASAEAAYASHVESRSADAPASERLQQLMERVRTLEGAPPSVQPTSPIVPLIGRSAQMAEACTVFERVKGGNLDLLLVSGEAGIGKTRLIEELHTKAVLEGFRCLRARPVELERRIALNPIIDALSSVDLRPHLRALGDPWSAVISSFLPASWIDGPPGEIPYVQDSSLSRRLLDAFWMLFDRLAQEGPTLLFLDDIHWADSTTIALLQFMQRRWKSGPLGVIAAVRPELIRKDDALSVLIEGADGVSVRTVHLRELDDSDARRLVDHVADRPLDESTRQHLCDLAANHPFYLTEVTKDFVAGRLSLPERTLETIPIPISLRQIFDARIENLSEGATRVAEVLAVRARPMRLTDLGFLADLGVDECADRVAELQRSNFVVVDRDRISISHELFRSALYKHIGDARRPLLHERVGTHMESLDASDLSGELAIHFAEAGESERAIHYAGIAATEARDSGAATAAANFFEIVVQNETDPARRASATADLAKALHMDRQMARANPMLELAATRLRQAGDETAARRMEILRVEGLAQSGATPAPDLMDRLAQVKDEAKVSEDWEAVALALDVELHLRHTQGDVPGIRALLDEMAVVAGVGAHEATCIVNASLGLSMLVRDSDDGVARGEKAVEIARKHGLEKHLLSVQCRLIAILVYSARLYLPDSQRLVVEARSVAERTGDRFVQCSLEGNVAVFQLDVGDLDEAGESLARAGDLLSGADLQRLSTGHHVNLAELSLLRHNFAEAESRYRGIREAFPSNPAPHVAKTVYAGLGLCALEQGRLAEARRFEELLESPVYWYYEPSLILRFRAALLSRRGMHQAALDVLCRDQPQLFPRMLTAWLKLRVIELEFAARTGQTIELQRIDEARAIAHDLRLHTMATRLDQLRERVK